MDSGMICHICKDKVATIRLKEIINNVVTELHLCRDCFEAREQQAKGGADTVSSKMLDSLEHREKGKSKEAEALMCPSCHISEEQFRSKGRLGCAECYTTFARPLAQILGRVHDATEHRGKIPRRVRGSFDFKNEMRRLQEDLQKAIQSENYERAAKLRDKIRHFENA